MLSFSQSLTLLDAVPHHISSSLNLVSFTALQVTLRLDRTFFSLSPISTSTDDYELIEKPSWISVIKRQVNSKIYTIEFSYHTRQVAKKTRIYRDYCFQGCAKNFSTAFWSKSHPIPLYIHTVQGRWSIYTVDTSETMLRTDELHHLEYVNRCSLNNWIP